MLNDRELIVSGFDISLEFWTICKYIEGTIELVWMMVYSIQYVPTSSALLLNNALFLTGLDSSSPKNMILTKVDISNIGSSLSNSDWTKYLTCPNMAECSSLINESILSSGGDKVFSYLSFGGPVQWMFLIIDPITGNLLSNIQQTIGDWLYALSIKEMDDNLYFITQLSGAAESTLSIYSLSANTFTRHYKTYNISHLFIDPLAVFFSIQL